MHTTTLEVGGASDYLYYCRIPAGKGIDLEVAQRVEEKKLPAMFADIVKSIKYSKGGGTKCIVR